MNFYLNKPIFIDRELFRLNSWELTVSRASRNRLFIERIDQDRLNDEAQKAET